MERTMKRHSWSLPAGKERSLRCKAETRKRTAELRITKFLNVQVSWRTWFRSGCVSGFGRSRQLWSCPGDSPVTRGRRAIQILYPACVLRRPPFPSQLFTRAQATPRGDKTTLRKTEDIRTSNEDDICTAHPGVCTQRCRLQWSPPSLIFTAHTPGGWNMFPGLPDEK